MNKISIKNEAKKRKDGKKFPFRANIKINFLCFNLHNIIWKRYGNNIECHFMCYKQLYLIKNSFYVSPFTNQHMSDFSSRVSSRVKIFILVTHSSRIVDTMLWILNYNLVKGEKILPGFHLDRFGILWSELSLGDAGNFH